jgi:hypothetical protein
MIQLTLPMRSWSLHFFSLLLFTTCGRASVSSQGTAVLVNTAGKEIMSRFNVPQGYTRVKSDSGSFAFYLQHFPLKPHGSKVYYYNGEEKGNLVYEAVLDIDVGEKDLQQCADAVMRLRAEYLYQQKKYDQIHFNFTSGFTAEYKRWANGERIKVDGNQVSWYHSTGKDFSATTFKKYLEKVFTYAGTLSLSRELKSVPVDDMQIGDVFIKGGSPGHAVIIVDMAVDANGKKIFMIAQSYMPAQSIQILKNPDSPKLSPWYDLSKTDKLYSPEWTFEKTQLMRFGE